MKKIHLIAILFLSLNMFAQNINDKIKLFENDFYHWNKSKKKSTLKERMSFYNVNAVSIAVIKDYKIEWAKAYGFADVSEKRAATPQTLFQAGSISKTINSLGILKLVQEGKLGLDDDINNHLKTWKFPYDDVSKEKKITIANLLSHTAGLSVHGFGGYEKGAALPTTIQTLDGLKPSNSGAVRSVFEPGLKYQYSGGGTTITQLILENTTGEKYEDYILKNILEPLGMNNSSFSQPPAKDKENWLATGYNYDKEVKGKYHIYPEKAAAGLWTNPTDLAKYVIETQLSLLGKSDKVLSKEMSQKRLENHFGTFSNDYAGAKYFHHDGGTNGFVCFYMGSVDDGNGIVVMTNGNTGKLMEEIVTSIAALNQFKNYPLESGKESISFTIRKELSKSVDNGIEHYKNLKKTKPDDYNFLDESELNILGYEYLNNGNIDSAIKIFTLNINEFPNSANVYDSRAEAYFNKKEYQLSKKDYQKVLELEQANPNAKEMLSKINQILSLKN
ncbi:serine hydrolase domain-containing protein [Chryseobacterium jejuense]|uniref:serine hydrolase domain-containing protein n=1 Tax=Chryseobacterium jejuense TaxID=445960 RepID=UPI001AEA8371|nr:serine hydrolase domain-containing protein [Chryseobacterium jejuense]MBP2619628.1 CubicO group peptidase (beta-lactamase class C family) [Chryseobacterium jejuense]